MEESDFQVTDADCLNLNNGLVTSELVKDDLLHQHWLTGSSSHQGCCPTYAGHSCDIALRTAGICPVDPPQVLSKLDK